MYWLYERSPLCDGNLVYSLDEQSDAVMGNRMQIKFSGVLRFISARSASSKVLFVVHLVKSSDASFLSDRNEMYLDFDFLLSALRAVNLTLQQPSE